MKLSVGSVTLSIILFVLISWVVNFIKLTNCDFAGPYKCEVIHALGLLPLIAPFAVWFDSDA